MSSIPTAGLERDAEIAKFLGVDQTESIAIDLDLPEGATAPFSTNRPACNALAAAMKTRGYELSGWGRVPAIYACFTPALRHGGRSLEAIGLDYCDAVSGAALLAFRECA